MRRYQRSARLDHLLDIRFAVAPSKVNMRTIITHRRRKLLGNERNIGVVLYKGTISRKGVKALELVDVPL